jgi:hypothetical protein
LVQNKLLELVLAIEAECPVGKYFGFSGIGEGEFHTEVKGSEIIADFVLPVSNRKEMEDFIRSEIKSSGTITISKSF